MDKYTKAEGPLAERLVSLKVRRPKARLSVSATVHRGEMGAAPSEWRKEERKRLREEIQSMHKMIDKWDPLDVADRALKSLKTDLAVKRARLMESDAMIRGGK
jgi:hypothetical protein